MSKTKKELSLNEIKELCEAKKKLDNAKTKYDMLKDAYCPEELLAGKYFIENVGVVTKNKTIRGTVNYKKLLEEHPEIDVEKYTEYAEVTSILVKPLNANTSILKHIF